MELLDECLKNLTLKEISQKLDVSYGTVKRWKILEKVPSQYTFDFNRILDKQINYSEFSSASKDQIFTSKEVVEKCWEIFTCQTKVNLEEYTFVEPSAGDGSFLSVLPENSIMLDIEPRHPRILKQDFLYWKPEDSSKKYIVFGNPPFGLRGHLALKFINHSSTFAEYTCFILPQLFSSDGKGTPAKRVSATYNLLHSESILGQFSDPEGRKRCISVVFQIYTSTKLNLLEVPSQSSSKEIEKFVKIYSLSSGGTPGTTRNLKMLDCCDIYLPSTCFDKNSMKIYTSFKELPNLKGYGVVFLEESKEDYMQRATEIDWGNESFLSTNLSYNLRKSIILKQF